MKKASFSGTDHLYMQVAEGIEKMISTEVWKIGDKLPSVRMLSNEYGISMGTAFQAYYHLEAKGLIESRPKSGYYVRFTNKRLRAIPAHQPVVDPVSTEVSTKEMIARVFKDIGNKQIINFSHSVPAPELLPAAKLGKSVTFAMRNAKTHCMEYAHYLGYPALRQQIARLAFNWGGNIEPEEVIVTSGCMEALALCLQAVTKPGDTVAVERPAYFGIYHMIENLGLKVVEIASDPVTGVDLDCLERVLRQVTVKACLFVPTFSNPTGSCMPDENRKKLVDMITHYRIPLIEDDIYGEMYFGRQRPKTCRYYDQEGWVMHCASLSKSMAPGFRIGWVLPGRFSARIRELKMMNTVTSATLTQVATAHFLATGRYDYHLKTLRKALHTQCLRYTQAITEYFPACTKVSRPQGGFVLWLELDPSIHAYELCHEALKHQIHVAPGQLFSISGCYRNYLRISYGNPWSDKVEKGLKTLGGLAKKLLRS